LPPAAIETSFLDVRCLMRLLGAMPSSAAASLAAVTPEEVTYAHM